MALDSHLVVAVRRGCLRDTVCPGSLLISHDSGTRWLRVREPAAIGSRDSIAIRGARVAVQLHRRLIVSTDGGRHFVRRHPGCVGDAAAFGLNLVAFDPSATLWDLCGGVPGTGDQGKVLYRSHDLGRHWELAHSTSFPFGTLSKGYLGSLIAPASATLLLTTARGPLYETASGGRRWRLAIPDINEAIGGPGWLASGDRRHFWAGIYGDVVFHTADGGRHWRRIPARRLLHG